MARTVVDPSGTEWRVGRQWMPWRPRWRKPDADIGGDWWDLGFGDDLLAGILFVIGLAVAVILLFVLVFPLVAIAVEIVAAVLVLLVLTGLRFTFVLPWTVRATAVDARRYHSWKVKGWRASSAKIDEVAQALAEGRELIPIRSSPGAST